ncbi:MAG: alanyl-tRNA editing protein [Candidatus Nanoarchaeia archaeon]|nr:alanyl-tRNA editing protein [Candidatus Nanoarchaeia archaeon]
MKECYSRVAAIEDNKVWLDKTVFFAFSGGQASDKGTINGINVLEAVKQNEDEIYYILEKEPDFAVGDNVKVEIDWDYRYKIMKIHSAAHIVYYYFIEKVGQQKVIGSNISIDKARLDFAYDESVGLLLEEIQEKTNNTIKEGIDIKTFQDEKDPTRRFWECGKWLMPCGGTHVKNTKEIGQIKLKRKNIGAGKERIEVILV